MRSNEERIEMMHLRASALRQEKQDRNVRIMQAASMSAALAIVIAVSLMVPRFAGQNVDYQIPEGMNASMFAGGNTLGFIVIAVFSFLLGISVTILCFHLKNYGRKED